MIGLLYKENSLQFGHAVDKEIVDVAPRNCYIAAAFYAFLLLLALFQVYLHVRVARDNVSAKS